MQTIDTYKKENYLRLLLQGASGSGKTTLACHFPNVYIADLDINLGGPLRYLRNNKGPMPIGYDIIDRNGNGKTVPPEQRYQRLAECLNEAAGDPKIETIVIDSASKLSDYLISEVLRTQHKSDMTLQLWGFYLNAWKNFVSRMSVIKKHLVLICHERVDKDEIDQALRYFILIPGQTQYIIGSLFTDIWRTEVAVTGVPAKYTFQIRTMPDHRYQLKNSLGLPPVMKFDWKVIKSQLET